MQVLGMLGAARRWFGGLSAVGQSALIGVLFIGAVGFTWNSTLIAEEFVIDEINPGAEFISTWPAGPTAGIAPLAAGLDPDADGCVALEKGDTVDLVPHSDTSAFWVRAEPDDKVILSWVDSEVAQRILMPAAHFANEFERGRVTVTLAGRTGEAVARIEVARGSALLCGVQANADRSGGPLAATDLLTSWPAGPLVGSPPVVLNLAVNDEGCVLIEESAAVDLVPDQTTSSIWVFAESGSRIQLDWTTDMLEQSLTIPEGHLANESAQGRVTVTMADASADAVVRITARRSAARVCGVVSR